MLEAKTCLAEEILAGLEDFAQNGDHHLKKTTFKYAFFSLDAAKIFGVFFHENTQGTITYTGLSSLPQGDDYQWTDRRFVGVVPERYVVPVPEAM